MISVKHFIETLHQAIAEASSVMEEKNQQMLSRYFERKTLPDGTEQLSPRMVTLTVPDIDEEGTAIERTVDVPLISLIPCTASKIEKATFSADFRLTQDGADLCMNFVNDNLFRHKTNHGHLEIVITPDDSVEGLQQLIDTYTETLKKQL